MIKKLLTIDNGNTNPHVGIFHDEELSEVITLNALIENIERYENYKAVLSTVGKNLEHTKLDFLEVSKHKSKNIFLDMPFQYSETIGDDRLYQSYFVFKNFIRDNLESVLLIDAGTFTTIDFINKKGLQGGYIFPGIQTFLNSYSRGELLPVFEAKNLTINTEPHLSLPKTTEEAITKACEIFLSETLKSITAKRKPKAIIITGGFSNIIKEILDGKVQGPCLVDPNLIHFSLNEIAKKILTK